MREHHLDFLSPPLSGPVELRAHAKPCKILDDLILLSADCAYITVWTAFGLGRAIQAVGFLSPVFCVFSALLLRGRGQNKTVCHDAALCLLGR